MLTAQLNDGQPHGVGGQGTHLVLQRKSSARLRAGNGVIGVETVVKLKTLKLNQEVPTHTFAITPHPKRTEAELVSPPGEEGLSLTNQPAVGFALNNLEDDTVSLNALQSKLVEQGVAVVGVSAEETGVVRGYIKKQNFTFPILLDSKREVSKRYGIHPFRRR